MNELVFTNLTAEAMQMVLEWMYGVFKDCLTLPQAVAVFLASHRFDITELQLQSERILKAYISFDTYAQLRGLAKQFHCSGLRQVKVFAPFH